MIQAIQQLQQDMEPWKLACMAGLILSAVVYCWYGARQENARMRALARAEARPYLAYAVDEIERMGRTARALVEQLVAPVGTAMGQLVRAARPVAAAAAQVVVEEVQC